MPKVINDKDFNDICKYIKNGNPIYFAVKRILNHKTTGSFYKRLTKEQRGKLNLYKRLYSGNSQANMYHVIKKGSRKEANINESIYQDIKSFDYYE
jgi:hypothetical protein